MMICGFCGEDHSWLYCRKKPEGWKPPKKSTAAQKAAPSGAASPKKDAAGTQSRPVDAPKRGRPRTGFDKKAYDRLKAAERRAKIKAGK